MPAITLFKPVSGVAVKAMLGAAALCWAAASPALTWNISYDDVLNNTGVGFDDPASGAARQATLDAVTGYLSSVLTGAPGTIDLQIRQSELDGTGVLGTGGTYFFTAPNGFSNGFAFRHATTGVDPASSVPDAFVTFDFGHDIHSGLDAPGANQVDLYSLALHEIMHGLGFLTLLRADGTSSITGTDPGVYTVFNSRLARGDGTKLFAPNGDFIGNPSDLTSDDLFFDGVAANDANGGNPVKLNAPATGGSVAHLDDATFPTAVTNTTLNAGEQRRELSEIELGILTDLGYNVTPGIASSDSTGATVTVPLPGGLWLVLGGLVILLRQRRQRRLLLVA